ncbi:hypothetical protein Cgig2_027326 [Carnegiea gigantea]|uniref:Uncharacterized protein n=1 Tax=Carnegiea gigantea TaxID=171969 RepID=A0A9Q1GHX1_9CARY|nr:hypothetical protein Cgig2_027326 [Carnegiea gigantea]
MDGEYDKTLQKNALELTQMLEFILVRKDRGESFKKNFNIYLVNCFFNGPKNHYCRKSILKYLKDVSLIASLNWCQFVVHKLITSVRHYKESTAAKGKASNNLYAPPFSPTVPLDKLDREAEIPGDILVFDASIIIEKEEHCEDVVIDQPKSITKKDYSMPSYNLGLRLSQPDRQSPVPQSTFVPDPNNAAVNRELSVKKPTEKKPKEGDEHASKRGEVKKQINPVAADDWLKSTISSQCQRASRTDQTSTPVEQNKGSPRASSEQVATNSRKPKLTKEVLPEKHDKKRLGATRTPEKLEEVGPSDALKNELSQDELTISEYVFGKVEDVDDSEPLLDGCSEKAATRASMVTLRPGVQLEMNVINIWSSILNDWERKRDLATPSRFFISCDQSHFFSRQMLRAASFEKRYEDFKVVMDRELERCSWIKIKQVNLVRGDVQ